MTGLAEMPRPPSHYSIVREIRKRLGITQEQLAARLGVGWSTVNRIENGDMEQISRRLALLLSDHTGVHLGDILRNREGEPRTWYGNLTKHLPLRGGRRDQFARALGVQHLKTLIGNAEYRAELILRAMMESAPQRLWTLDSAIEIAFDELEREFGLQEIVERLRRAPAPFKIKRPPPVGMFKEAIVALSGRSTEDRAARKLAALKRKPKRKRRRK
jgi:transcriptional regulator with XRE-family HTH domain